MTERDLDALARISAELAEGDAAPADVLARHGLDEAGWTDASLRLGRLLAEDAGRDGALSRAFSEAFAAHQDRLRPAPPLTVEQWAALTHEIEESDAPAISLAAHGLTLADYFRLTRRFARLLAHDPQLAARHDAARESLEADDTGPADELGGIDNARGANRT